MKRIPPPAAAGAAASKATKVTGDLKVGSKVTIEYRMTAATIEAQDAKAKEPKKK